MHNGRVRLVAVTVALTAAWPAAVPAATAQDPASTVAPPAIVPFEDWAPAACPNPTGGDAASTDRVVVHHSHHPTAATPDDVLPALAEMCQLHVTRGFDTLGYHYVVDPWGTVYQGRGRLPDESGHAPAAQPEGAHVHGSNPGAVGVVFLGDHEAEPPTADAVDTAVRLLAWLVEATGRDPGSLVGIESTGRGTALHEGHVEVEVLAGHSATNATLCPGEHLIALLEPIRQRVRDRIAGGGGTLVATDSVQPAPPAEPASQTRLGAFGLVPASLLLAPLLVTHARPSRDLPAPD